MKILSESGCANTDAYRELSSIIQEKFGVDYFQRDSRLPSDSELYGLIQDKIADTTDEAREEGEELGNQILSIDNY